MSSAILYLAIVAIWACVLIPRWLRRDSARGVSAPAAAEPAVLAEPDAEAEDGTPADVDGAVEADEAPRRIPAPGRAAEPVNAEESRRRMLAARRRLLLMLVGLEVAAIALAVLRLAAVWVVVPPTIMLMGYLLLLREAAQADAERAQYEAESAAHAARARLNVQARRSPRPRARTPRASPRLRRYLRRNSPPRPFLPTMRTQALAVTSRPAWQASTRPRTRTPRPPKRTTTRLTKHPGCALSATSRHACLPRQWREQAAKFATLVEFQGL